MLGYPSILGYPNTGIPQYFGPIKIGIKSCNQVYSGALLYTGSSEYDGVPEYAGVPQYVGIPQHLGVSQYIGVSVPCLLIPVCKATPRIPGYPTGVTPSTLGYPGILG